MSVKIEVTRRYLWARLPFGGSVFFEWKEPWFRPQVRTLHGERFKQYEAWAGPLHIQIGFTCKQPKPT